MANTPPSKAPTTPVVFGNPTTISITVRFVITNITGKPPPTYSILYGTTTNPTTVGTATPVPKSKTTYQAVINNLKPNTTYYIKSVAKNSVGIKSSSSAIIKTALPLSSPSKAPTVPVVFGTPTATSITKRFNVAGITGNPRPTYSILYGTTTNPTTVGTATLVSGTLYQSILNSLIANTTYYIKSVAKNSVGSKTSTSAIIKTSTDPPSKAPTVPVVFGTPTATSITVRFVITNITGTPTPIYSILYGTTTNPTTVGIATPVSNSLTTYQAVLNGLTANTTYYIKSVAKNSAGSKTSSSANIKTGIPPSKAPTTPVVFGTPTSSSITVQFNVAGITGDLPITYSILYGTTTNPTTVGSVTFVSGTTYQAVLNGLTANTIYYIKSVATNSAGSKTSATYGDYTGEKLKYRLISGEDSKYEIFGFVPNVPLQNLVIPSSYNDKPVTRIDLLAFAGYAGLTGPLTIPNSVTSIRNSAFENCSGLTGPLTIPNSVTSIDSGAFEGCSNLTGLTLGTGLISIGSYAFSRCSGLTGPLTIPNSVTSISSSAFQNCSRLTGPLTIPNSVTSIGSAAFKDCTGLTGPLTISISITSIGDGVFENCTGLTGTLTIPNNVISIGPYAFGNCSGLTGTLTIPNSVITIGEGAFKQCSKLTGTLTIPNTITSIGNQVFEGCSGLTGTLTIPNSVTSIGIAAFKGCTGLTGTVTVRNGVPSIDTDAFLNTQVVVVQE